MAQQTLNTPRETTHQRIAVALEDIVDKITDTSDADNINYNNTASGLQATKVQGAIDELASEKADKSTTLAGYGITDAYTKTETDTLLDGKVDKITGKGLSTNDYTTADKNKLAGIEAEANKTVVDSAMSDSSTNPLQNKVITKELEGSKTTSGNPLTIEDAAPVNAVNLSMDLEPIQDMHGYDHPWVGGAGKNKLPMTVDGIKAANTSGTWSGNNYTLSGITFTIQTDSNNNVIGIKINGTKNGDSAILNLANYTASSGDKLNGCNDTTSNTYYIYARGGGSVCRNSDVTISNNDVGVARLYAIAVINNTAISNAIVYPMIRLSTETDSSFAPYSNYASISGRSEVAIQRAGKNLFDKNATDKTKNHFINYTTGNVTYSTNWSISGYIKTKDGVSYALSGINNLSTSNFTVAFYDKNKTFIRGVASQNMTFTIPSGEGIEYIRFDYKNADENTIQLELGSATTYEPYAGKTYTIQLGQTVYGAHLDATRGKMVVDRGYIASYNGETLPSSWISDRDVYTSGTTPTIGAQVVYELATPYTIDLTPQQIKMLENTNTLSSDGNMALEYQPNNAIGEAVRVVEESYDPEFAVRPVLKKKAFSGTTDSDGAVTLINASDIPSGHKIIPLHITDMTIDGNAGTYFVEYEPYNSGDSVKGYCYFYMSGSQMFPVGKAITGNFYYYELEV